MKFLHLMFAMCCILTSLHSRIEFITSFDKAKKLASEQQKIIFVDVMADWCVPCKRMIQEINTKSEIYNYFNENFINLQINEKYNRSFLSKYQIDAFPTLLYLNNLGEVIHKIRGFQSVYDLLDQAKICHEQRFSYLVDQNLTIENLGVEIFIDSLKKILIPLSNDSRKKGLEYYFHKKETYPVVLMKHFGQFISYNVFLEEFKKIAAPEQIIVEQLLVSFLFDNNNYLSQKNLNKEFKNLEKVTKMPINKLSSFLMAYREFNLMSILGTTSDQYLLIFAKSLLTTYPEVSDMQLLYDAFSFTIMKEPDKLFYSTLKPGFLQLADTNTDNYIYDDILSVICCKEGLKKEASSFIKKAADKSQKQGYKYTPLLDKFRKEIDCK